MKVTSIALAIAAMGSVDAKEFADRKTPFQRRIEKSFGLFDEWGASQMAGHSKYSQVYAELDNKEQFKTLYRSFIPTLVITLVIKNIS